MTMDDKKLSHKDLAGIMIALQVFTVEQVVETIEQRGMTRTKMGIAARLRGLKNRNLLENIGQGRNIIYKLSDENYSKIIAIHDKKQAQVEMNRHHPKKAARVTKDGKRRILWGERITEKPGETIEMLPII